MSSVVSPQQWAEHHFGSVDLGHAARNNRLVYSAARISQRPGQSFPQIFDWNDLRGFYRLCHRSEATLPNIQSAHWQHTRQAMTKCPLVLNVHDTTELDFKSHPALKGTGTLGPGNEGRGFLQHNSLAFDPRQSRLLGLSHQQFGKRIPAPEGDHSGKRKQRQRESEIWREGIEAVGEAPQGCCWVNVADGGADDYETMRTTRDLGQHFLFSVAQNRTVYVDEQHSRTAYLKDYARTLSSWGTESVELPSRGGRPARTATVQMAAAPVWIGAPDATPQRKQQPIYAAWVIRVWEADPPADVEEPLEWLLICSVPTVTFEQIQERREWYEARWPVETFHDIEKNGCIEEDRRFETAESMEAALAILSTVAVRVFQMRYALEHQPQAPAQQVATSTEIRLIRRFVRHWCGQFTVRDFVRGVAKLGGFLGRRRDGNPGVRSLWRGYQRLQDMVLGAELQGDSSPQTQHH